MPRKYPRTPCLACGKDPAYAGYKYCSNKCQQEFEYRTFIKEWQAGEIIGLTAMGTVSPSVKRYLREKFSNKCCLCGWSEINQSTGVAPLIADHIDGNWRNNIESNLRLLCPNCDALTPTFSALNKGRGRKNRRVSKRTLEARILIARTRPI